MCVCAGARAHKSARARMCVVVTGHQMVLGFAGFGFLLRIMVQCCCAKAQAKVRRQLGTAFPAG